MPKVKNMAMVTTLGNYAAKLNTPLALHVNGPC